MSSPSKHSSNQKSTNGAAATGSPDENAKATTRRAITFRKSTSSAATSSSDKSSQATTTRKVKSIDKDVKVVEPHLFLKDFSSASASIPDSFFGLVFNEKYTYSEAALFTEGHFCDILKVACSENGSGRVWVEYQAALAIGNKQGVVQAIQILADTEVWTNPKSALRRWCALAQNKSITIIPAIWEQTQQHFSFDPSWKAMLNPNFHKFKKPAGLRGRGNAEEQDARRTVIVKEFEARGRDWCLDYVIQRLFKGTQLVEPRGSTLDLDAMIINEERADNHAPEICEVKCKYPGENNMLGFNVFPADAFKWLCKNGVETTYFVIVTPWSESFIQSKVLSSNKFVGVLRKAITPQWPGGVKYKNMRGQNASVEYYGSDPDCYVYVDSLLKVEKRPGVLFMAESVSMQLEQLKQAYKLFKSAD